jgi:hypothetical protein
MGCMIMVFVDQGCLREGVLFLPLWSFVVDELLVLPRGMSLCIQGCDDDMTLLITKKFPGTVSEAIQRVSEHRKHFI